MKKEDIIEFLRLYAGLLCPFFAIVFGIGIHTWLLLIAMFYILPFPLWEERRFFNGKLGENTIAVIILAIIAVFSICDALNTKFYKPEYKVISRSHEDFDIAEMDDPTLYTMMEGDDDGDISPEVDETSAPEREVTTGGDADSEPAESVASSDTLPPVTDAEESEAASPEETTVPEETTASDGGHVIPEGTTYVLNKNTKKFHLIDCSSVKKIKAKNFGTTDKDRASVIADGYAPCGSCKP